MVVQGTKGDGSDVGTAAQYSNSMQFDTQAFQQRSMDFMIWDNYFVFNPMGLRSDILSSGLEWKLNLKFETRCLSAAASQVPVQIQCHDGGSCCPECTVLLS